jgi:hypothetical protein
MRSFTLSIGIGLLLSFALPAIARGAQIGVNDFTAAAIIQNFEGLTNGNHISPFLIGSDTYDSDNHNVRSSSKFGPVIGRSGVAISNDSEGSSASTGYLDIVLATPALRAGMYVGFETPWAASASFYDTGNNLLGTIGLGSGAGSNNFAGWQTIGGLIERIRVVDQTTNNPFSIIIDDLIQEVPEPATAILAAIGLMPFFRRHRQSPAQQPY